MRRHKGHDRDVHVHVTNITNVISASASAGAAPAGQSWGGRKKWRRGGPEGQKRHHGHGGPHQERPPKLLRHFLSGGALDRDVAMRMDDGEFVSDITSIGGYIKRKGDRRMRDAARRMRDNVGQMADGVRGMFDGVCGMFAALFK